MTGAGRMTEGRAGAMAGFSGSYDPADVTFLLKPVVLAPTAVEEKERLIQSGRRHYSEMLGAEPPPDAEYLALFDAAFAANRQRFARDLAALAAALAERPGPETVLVSLARAGTPVGVLLRRALARRGRTAPHYSVSIIRDRGIDTVALDHILARHAPESVVFVDGWTGKGAIAGELRRAVDAYNAARGVRLDPSLTVVADLCGTAGLAATAEDYLIPSAILNAVVSGLVSRTVLNRELVGPGEFHACVHYHELAPHDRSRWFVDALDRDLAAFASLPAPARWPEPARDALRDAAAAFVAGCLDRFGIADRNRVKPGIGETTRALLRRMPERVLVKDPSAPDLRHMVHLAQRRGVALVHEPDLAPPYRAAAIIRTLGEG